MAFVEAEKPRLHKLTLTLAKRFRDMERFPRDREIGKARCEFIRKAAINKEFRGAEWVSAYCEETDKTYRLNGKHTSFVLAELLEAGKEIDCQMLVREYICETMEDCAKLYATFDARQSSRTKRDLIRSFAATNEVLDDIPDRQLSVITGGLAYAIFEEQAHAKDAQEQGMILLENTEFATWFHSLLCGESSGCGKYSHLLRLPVAAAMFRTWRKAPQKATEFWTQIRDDSNDPVGAPTRVLFRFLLTHVTHTGADRTRKEVATNREVFVRCLHGWNAWRRGLDSTKLKYYADAPIPAVA